ncbi:glycoside hydrolase superfamily [Lactarius indigo]|nr:glycoside hydrolase superfamily [Lactarius indigo]
MEPHVFAGFWEGYCGKRLPPLRLSRHIQGPRFSPLRPRAEITPSSTMTTKSRCGRANSMDLLTCQRRRTTFAGGLLSTRNDLISLGVDGLRLDAAKHMDPDDITDILSRLTSQPYVTQEIIWGEEQPVTPDLYTGNGNVQEFRYTSALRDAFLGIDDEISSLEDLDSRGWVAGSSANAFVSNHDTERNKDFTERVLAFERVHLGHHLLPRPSLWQDFSPVELQQLFRHGCWSSQLWLCQHCWPAISGMVGFRNQVGRAPVTRWVSPSSQRIAFARGSDGFVAINHEDSAWSTTFMTGLPGGSYCNVIDGSSSPEGHVHRGRSFYWFRWQPSRHHWRAPGDRGTHGCVGQRDERTENGGAGSGVVRGVRNDHFWRERFRHG